MEESNTKRRQTVPLSAILRPRTLLHQLMFCPFSPSAEVKASLVVDVVGLLAER